MDTITISAEWWCPVKRVPQTKKDLAREIGQLAASHIRFSVLPDGGDGAGCLVRAELCVCTGEPDGEEA